MDNKRHNKVYQTGFAPQPQGRFARVQRFAANTLRSTLCASLIIQSTFVSFAQAQQIILDPNGNVGFSPTVNNTSPAPTVNIATPNSGGVSVNQYSNFSIDEHGVVLNNSTTGGISVLNGSVAANPNLVGGAADTIVNEVTSSVASTLSGPTEVAGQRADVIIANPNGVTCNGCSFINTGQATLSSGRPVVNGSVVTLDVRTGTVTIGANGLDGAATGVDGVNLVGRAVIVNGRLTAIEQITASGGAQRFNVKTRRATSQAGTGPTPEYAVDAANFGAMQAGQIQIIGNEAGLGVRALGALDATTGNLTLGSQGDLTVKSGRAKGNVAINAAGTVHQERDISALEGTVTIEAQDYTSTERSGIYGRDGIYLTATERAQISGQWQSRELISVGANDIFLDGVMRTDGELRLEARNDIEAIGLAVLADTITLNAGGLTHIDASYFTALTDFRIITDSFHLGPQNVFSAPDIITVDVAGTFINGADLRNYTNLDITFGGDLVNLETGVFAETDLDLTVNGTITNEGILIGEDTATLTAEELINTSTGIIAGGDVSFAFSGDITNDGLIEATASLTLASGGDVTNRGVIVAPTLIAGAVNLTNGATGIIALNDAGTITVNADLVNVGEITAVNSLDITADGSLTNLNLIGANDTVALAANAIVNAGLVFSGNTLSVTSNTSIANLGRLEAANNLSLTAGTILASSGAIDTGGVLSISSPTTSLVAGSSTIASSLGLSSDTVTASGFLAVNDDLVINAATSFAQNGTLYAAGDLSITTGSLTTGAGSATVAGVNFADNTASLNAAANIILTASTADLDGLIVAGGSLDANFTGAANIAGSLESGSALMLTAGDLTTTAAARLIATTDADVSATGNIAHAGVLYGTNTATVTAAGALSIIGSATAGTIGAGTSATLTGNSIDNGGLVYASNSVLATATTTLANSGRIESGDALALSAGSVLSNAGQIDATGLLSLTATDLAFATGSSTLATRLDATADTLTNAGTIAIDGAAALTIADAVTQNGALYTAGSLTINTASLTTGAASATAAGVDLADNTAPLDTAADIILSGTTADLGGLLISGGALNANFSGTAAISGSLEAGTVLTVGAGSLTTTQTARLFATTDANVSATGDLSHAGTIYGTNTATVTAGGALSTLGSATAGRIGAGTSVTLAANSIDNGGLVYASNSVLATATTTLANSGRIESGGALSLTAGTVLSNAGQIDATGLLSLTATDLSFAAGSLTLGTSLDATAQTLTTAGTVAVNGALALSISDAITQNGALYAAGSLSITTANLSTGSGSFTAAGVNLSDLTAPLDTAADLILTTATSDLDGTLAAGGAITATSTGLTEISGSVRSGDTLSVTAAGLTTTATAYLSSVTDTSLTSTAALTTGGTVDAGGNLTLEAATRFTNTGFTRGSATVSATAADITQNGALIGDTIVLNAGNSFAQTGDTIAQTQTTLTAGGAATIGGQFASYGDLVANAENLTITGDVIAQNINLSATDAFSNAGVINSTINTALNAGTTLTNSGEIDAQGNLTVTALDILNEATGVISGLNTTATATASLTNQGDIGAVGLLDLDAGTTFSNSGSLRAATIDLAAQNIDIAAIGTLNADIAALTATDTFTNAGDLVAQDWIQIQSDSLTNAGLILSANETTLIANTIVNEATGKIESRTAVRIAALNGLTNAGSVQSLGLVAIQVDNGNVINTGIVNGDQTFVTASGLISGNTGSIIGQTLTSLTASDIALLDNAGASRFDRLGLAVSGGDYGLTLSTGGLDIAIGEELVALGDLVISVADDITNAGLIRSGGDLSLTTDGDITNNEGVIKSEGDMALIAATGDLTNRSGLIEANGSLTINAMDVVNEYRSSSLVDVSQFGTIDYDQEKYTIIDKTPYNGEGKGGEIFTPPFDAITESCGKDCINYFVPTYAPEFQVTGSTTFADAGLAAGDIAVAGLNPELQGALTDAGILDTDPLIADNGTIVLNWAEGDKWEGEGAVPLIIAGGDLTVTADSLTNDAGTISAGGDMTITANTIANTGYENTFAELTKTVSYGPSLLGCGKDCTGTWITSYSATATQLSGGGITLPELGTLVAGGTMTGVSAGETSSFTNTGIVDANSINITAEQITTGIDTTAFGVAGTSVGTVTVDLTDFVSLAIRSNPTTSATGTDIAGPSVSVGLLTGTTQSGSGATTSEVTVGTTSGTTQNGSGATTSTVATGTVTGTAQATATTTSVPAPMGIDDTVEPTNGASGVIANPDYTTPTGTLTAAPDFSRDDLFAAIGASPNLPFLADPATEAEAIRLAAISQSGSAFLNDDWESVDEQQAALLANARDFAASQPDAQIGQALTPAQIAALDAPILWYVEQQVNGQTVLVPTLYLSPNEQNNNPPGSLIAQDNLSLTGGNITIAATDLSATNITINATGDVDIKSRKLVLSSDFSFVPLNGATGIFSESVQAPSLNATGNINILAGNDLTITGADLTAGGSLGLIALNDLMLGSVRTIEENNQNWGSGHKHISSVTSHVTSLNAGGDLLALSLGDAYLFGSKIASGGSTIISAGGNLVLAAVQDIESYSFANSSSSLLKKKSVTEDKLDVTNSGVQIASVGDLVLSSGASIITAGSLLSSEAGNIVLSATDAILAGAYTDTHYYNFTSSSSYLGGLISKTSAYTKIAKVSTGTDALAELDLTLVSGGTTTLVGTDLSAGNTLTLDIGGDLNVLAAIDSLRIERFESDVGAVTATTVTERSYDETAHLTSFTADNYNIDVDGAVNITVYTDEALEPASTVAPAFTPVGAPDGTITSEVEQDTEPGGTRDQLIDPVPTETALLDPTRLPVTTTTTTQAPLDLAALASGLYPQELLEQDGLNFLHEELAHEYFYEKTTSLSPAFKALLAVAVGYYIGPLAIVGEASGLSLAAATAINTGFTAAVNSAVIGGIDGIVSGDFDIADILEGAVFSGLTVGLTAGIDLDTLGINLGDVATGNLISGFGSGQLTLSGLLEDALDGIISSGISSLAYGTDFGDGVLSALVSSIANGVAGAAIEEVSHGLDLGELETTIAKAAINCIAAEAGGADCHAAVIGTLITDLLVTSGSLLGVEPGDNFEEEFGNRLELVAAIAGYFTSKGRAENVAAAATAAILDYENNCLKSGASCTQEQIDKHYTYGLAKAEAAWKEENCTDPNSAACRGAYADHQREQLSLIPGLGTTVAIGQCLGGNDAACSDILISAVTDIAAGGLIKGAYVLTKVGGKWVKKKFDDFVGTVKKVDCCFIAGTPIKTENGYKNIEDLEVDDKVVSQNVNTGEISLQRVIETHIRPISEIRTFYKLTVGNGTQSEDLFVTGEHPFWVTDRQEWITVDDIEIGAKLINHQGEALVVKAKVQQLELQQTYNITVGGFHTYFAGKLETLVHNCGYNSLKNWGGYPDGFQKTGAATKHKVNNLALKDELRKIGPGPWKKVYQDGLDANGNSISLHYFQNQSGKVAFPKVKPGVSNY